MGTEMHALGEEANGRSPVPQAPSRIRPAQSRLTVGAPKPRELLWAVALVAVPVVGTAYFGRSQIEDAVQAQVAQSLRATLGAAVSGVQLLLETSERAHRAAIADARFARAIACLAGDDERDCKPDLQGAVGPYLASLGSCAHVLSAARRRVWTWGCDDLDAVEQRVLLDGLIEATPSDGSPRFVSPIALSSARLASGFASRVAPDTYLFTSVSAGALSRSMIAARAGDSAETYAIDAHARMISESRFREQLRAAGLLGPNDSSSALHIELRDPGVDLTRGERAGTLRQHQPLTLLADSLLRGQSDMNVSGYRDYRGVWVVGAWQWLPGLGIGVATEIDRDEALRATTVLNRGLLLLIVVLAGLGTMLSIALIVAATLRRRAASALARVDAMGQYRIVRQLGMGGMGAVYLAQHQFLRRPTALKVLPASRVDVLTLARFEREVHATSELHHPNTVVIYDYGRADDGSFFYAMEYLEGLDLDELVATYGPLPEARVVHFLMQACGSLAEAHERGMVHRDVKPSNLFVCNRPGVFDLVKVLDFGIVKLEQAGDRPITHGSTLMGTPEFMSPEMFDHAAEVDAPSDLYSLGATAYFLLTAKPVFQATSLAEACSAHLMQQPVRPSLRIGHEIEPELEAVVLACLEKSPHKRPSSAAHLLELLSALPSAKAWSQSDAAAFWKAAKTNPAPPRSWLDSPASTLGSA